MRSLEKRSSKKVNNDFRPTSLNHIAIRARLFNDIQNPFGMIANVVWYGCAFSRGLARVRHSHRTPLSPH